MGSMAQLEAGHPRRCVEHICFDLRRGNTVVLFYLWVIPGNQTGSVSAIEQVIGVPGAEH